MMDHGSAGECSAVETLSKKLSELGYAVTTVRMCLSAFHENCSRPRQSQRCGKIELPEPHPQLSSVLPQEQLKEAWACVVDPPSQTLHDNPLSLRLFVLFIDEAFGGQEALSFAQHILARAQTRLQECQKVPTAALLLKSDDPWLRQVLHVKAS